MHPDEMIILQYLQHWPGEFVAAQQICRQADGRRRFETDPKWAFPVLNRLVEGGHLETDGDGRFRMPSARKEQGAKKLPSQWMSPKIRSILESRGKMPGPVEGE